MAHGGNLNNGEPNVPTFPLWEFDGQGDAFLYRMPQTSVEHVNGHEEQNHPDSPMSPTQQVAGNEDIFQIPRSMLSSQCLPEREDFLLYDYYDTDYSDSGNSEMEDEETINDKVKFGHEKESNSDVNKMHVDKEQEDTAARGAKKGASGKEEEQRERSTEPSIKDFDCNFSMLTLQHLAKQEDSLNGCYNVNYADFGNSDTEDDENTAEDEEWATSDYEEDLGNQEKQENRLPGGAKKRAKEKDEEQEDTGMKRLRYNFDWVIHKTQNYKHAS